MPVRLGFLGCDETARAQLHALENVDEARAIAFYDRDLARAQTLARRFGGKAFLTPQALLQSETLDALYLSASCTRDVAALAVGAGCALCFAFPLAQTRKELDALASGVSNAKLLAVAGSSWRYAASAARLQKLLNTKTNAPTLLELRAGVGRGHAEGLLDLARAFGGEIKRVTGVASAKPAVNVCALLEFASGAVGQATFSAIASEPQLRVCTREGVYQWTPTALSLQQNDETHTFASDDGQLPAQQAWIHAVKTGRRAGLKNSFSDALLTARVALAIEQAARTGKAVEIKT